MAKTGLWQRALVAIGASWPATVEAAEDVHTGRVQLEGTLACDAPLEAPVTGRPCAAFIYSASAVGSGRASAGTRMRLLRRATVYAPHLRLELTGGSVALEPPPGDDFDVEAHEALAALDLPGFKARVKTLALGDRVRVQGTARAMPDGRLSVRAVAITPASGSDASDASDA